MECKNRLEISLLPLRTPLYTWGVVEKSEDKKTLLKNIPVTILGVILAIDNNRFSEGFKVISLKLVPAVTVK